MISLSTITGSRLLDPIRSFFRWWGTELWDMVPETIRTRTRAAVHPLTIVLTADGYRAVLADGQRVPLNAETFKTLPQTAHIYVPFSALLVHEVTLPRPARKNVKAALDLRLDAYCPWKPDRVRITHRLLPRQHTADGFTVGLAIAPPDCVERAQECMAALGLPRASLRAQDTKNSVTYRFALSGTATQPVWRRWLTWPVLSTVLMSASLIFAVWAADRRASETMASAQSRLATLRPQLLDIADVRAEHKAISTLAAFHTERLAQPSSVITLNEVTKALPDGVWLTRFTLTGSTLSLEGETHSLDRMPNYLAQVKGVTDITVKPVEAPASQPNAKRFTATATIDRGQQ